MNKWQYNLCGSTTFFDTAGSDTVLECTLKFKLETYLPCNGLMISRLDKRIEAWKEIHNNYEFFLKLHNMDSVILSESWNKYLTLIYVKIKKKVNLSVNNSHITYKKKQEQYFSGIYKILELDKLQSTFPNTEITYWIYLSLLVTNCIDEKYLSKLKLIKNELSNHMHPPR